MDITPRLSLPKIVTPQADKSAEHNEALQELDALVGARFLDRDLSAPPEGAADGDMYLVKAPGTDAWSDQDGRIAYALAGGWRFCAPFAGMTATVADEARVVVFDGAAWREVFVPQNLPCVGIGATADDTNRLAVKSSAMLFDHAGAGVQAKLNKSAAGDTASLLFQTGYGGRAEFGLAGDDDLHVKTSPDGAAWREAMVFKATGRIGINTAAPVAPLELHVDGSVAAAGLLSSDDIVITKESGAAGFSGIVASDVNRRMVFAGRRARGTLGAPTAVAESDWTFSLLGAGYDGAAGRATAAISFTVDGAVSAGAVPQRITFETGTLTARIERVRVNATGEVGIGKTAAPGVLLDVAGPVGLKSFAVAALPGATQPGQLVYVSDESGGAVLAFSDGTTWRRVTDRAVVS
jgi:hypothetical protein